MYLSHKILMALIFAASFLFAWCSEFKVRGDFVSDCFSLMGILFGFTMTAAVAISGSAFLKRQSGIVDESACGILKSNAQRLCAYIALASGLDLGTVVLLVVYRVLPQVMLDRCFFSEIIIGVLFVTLYSSYLLLVVVLRYLNESADE